jgi:hypothetical protein
MAFAATHLAISLAIINSGYPITDISEFLLGSISPDSVHTSDSYNRAAENQLAGQACRRTGKRETDGEDIEKLT